MGFEYNQKIILKYQQCKQEHILPKAYGCACMFAHTYNHASLVMDTLYISTLKHEENLLEKLLLQSDKHTSSPTIYHFQLGFHTSLA